MRYVGTERFSPVLYENDVPWEHDYFFMAPEDITTEFLLKGDYLIDEEWWWKQRRRCIEGYTVKKATDTNLDIWIPGRYYFFLNFWQIRGIDKKTGRKSIIRPNFIDMQYELFFLVRERMYEEKKNNQWQKARQRGFSEMGACDIGYEYTFFPGSQSIIVAGEEKYTENMFGMTERGLSALLNTQFYKERSVNRNDYLRSKNSRSEIYSFTAKNNPQVVSGKSPSLIYFEEIGIWKKNMVHATYQYVEPSLVAERKKTGYACFIGCVCKGTKVYTSSGELKNIEHLQKQDGIYGYNNKGVCIESIIHINPPQKKECYRIETEYGDIIECSYDHPILTSNRNMFYQKRKYVNGKRVLDGKRLKRSEFKITKDIKVGDHVAMVDTIDLFGNKKMFDPRLIGMLIGDGSYGHDKTPVFSNCDIELNSYLNKYDTIVEKNYTTKDGREYKETRIKGICHHLRELGIYGQTKDKKRLPVDLHLYDKESIAEMIGGLFDTDGSVSISNCYRGKIINISITQLSRELLVDLKFALLKFGIHSNLYTTAIDKRDRRIKSDKDTFILQITNSVSVKRFSENIKLLIRYKQDILDMVDDYNYNNKMIESVSVRKVGRDGIIIKNENIFYNRVIKVENIGMKDVYNLTTSDSHTYIANAMITHNTGGEADDGVADAEHMFYNPAEFDLLEFDNIYEDDDTTDVKVACFVPGFLMEVMDEDGNSIKDKSIDVLEKERSSKSAANRYKAITLKPFKPSESFFSKIGGFFGVVISQWCNERKAYINTHKEAQIVQRGRLEWKNPARKEQGVDWMPDEDGPFMIAEHPIKDKEGNVILNLYKAATDSYDQDEALTSSSKGACWIKKSFYNAESISDQYVAGIIERPSVEEGGAERFYEYSALLCVYYGAINLIEYSKIRIFDWYHDNGLTYLLKERPEFVTSMFIDNTNTTNKYGIDPNTKIHWLKMLHEWLSDKKNIDTCPFVDLLDAWSRFRYDKKYNCDNTIATSLCTVLMEDEKEYLVHEINKEPERFKYWKRDSSGRMIAIYK